jgi:hypothetical protein
VMVSLEAWQSGPCSVMQFEGTEVQPLIVVEAALVLGCACPVAWPLMVV